MNGGFTINNSSSFIDLLTGVDASGVPSNRPFSFYNTTFTNTKTGIFAKNINSMIVHNCTFNTGGNLNPDPQTGIITTNSSGFSIEDNHFNGSGNSIKHGIVTSNSGPADNQIYNNWFTGLNKGNVATKINRDNSSPIILHGLQYLCNKNQSNTTCDFFVGKQVGLTPFGIRANQGTNNLPAGNTFSHQLPAIDPTDIYNKTSTINYYYWSGAAVQEPLYYNIPNVTVFSVTIENTCPANTGGGGIGSKLPVKDINTLTNIYDSSETIYLNLLYTYNQLMDGGSTNALLNQIQQNWSAQAWMLRDQLLAHSPYVSQDILRQVADDNNLPQAMLLTVCMANPDATRDMDFLDYLKNIIPNPLPQYMIDMIIASWNTQTVRTAMESTLADYSNQMATSSDRLLADLYFRGYLENDSIFPSAADTADYNATIRYWLQRVQTLTAKYDLIENYFAKNELSVAQNILDSIPYNFNLSQDQQEAYDDYVYFYNFRKNLFTAGHTLFELDSIQITALVTFTQDGDNFAKGQARNVLCYYYNICREENYDQDSTNLRLSNNNSKNNIKHDKNSVNVMPNPASTFATFSYVLPSLKEQAILVILNYTGTEIARIILKGKEGQEIWDTRNINNGLYYFYVKDGNRNIAKGKVEVIR